MTTRTIFITGGIVSGLGKGITAASLGALLKARGFSVAMQKADPYLNVDAGTMNPFQHGEVFVTDDGAETDLDLGHYERFLDQNTTRLSNFTTGSVYQSVTEGERKGDYLGKTIQIIPHVTDEICRRIAQMATATRSDFQVVEIGGTVGDFEAEPFLEAIRQYGRRPRQTVMYIHVVKMDYVYPSDEAKTKPLQHSVIRLRGYGLTPDMLIVRAKRPITRAEREKIALFCGLDSRQIVPALDAVSLYDIPVQLEREGLTREVLRIFRLRQRRPNLTTLAEVVRRTKVNAPAVAVGLVGKYTNLSDAYLSVIEAVKHAGLANRARVSIVPIDSETVTAAKVDAMDAIIVPGGFGRRGIEGKVYTISRARTRGQPFLGLCLGLQCAVIEYARGCCRLRHATSEEFNPKAKQAVVAFLPEQTSLTRKGASMRLGRFEAKMRDSLVSRLYRWGESGQMDFPPLAEIRRLPPVVKTFERHRHRYEVNPLYHPQLAKAGLVFAGTSPDGRLVEFIELPAAVHPYFVATQAHPEFSSRPARAHPLFAGLVRAALER